tara:strand:- start:651 stop:1133 length:483 start_codon:yes stop_codon:yes gene_type:complete
MKLEIPIRENGRIRWIEIHPSVISKLRKKAKSPILPSLNQEFNDWYNLYNKKTTKKQALNYWLKNITEDLIPKIMSHTKKYIKDRERVYRLDPIRYLKRATWEDEVISDDKEYENYKLDTRGASRFGYCSKCGDTYFGGIKTIHLEETKCCNAKILTKRG